MIGKTAVSWKRTPTTYLNKAKILPIMNNDLVECQYKTKHTVMHFPNMLFFFIQTDLIKIDTYAQNAAVDGHVDSFLCLDLWWTAEIDEI